MSSTSVAPVTTPQEQAIASLLMFSSESTSHTNVVTKKAFDAHAKYKEKAEETIRMLTETLEKVMHENGQQKSQLVLLKSQHKAKERALLDASKQQKNSFDAENARKEKLLTSIGDKTPEEDLEFIRLCEALECLKKGSLQHIKKPKVTLNSWTEIKSSATALRHWVIFHPETVKKFNKISAVAFSPGYTQVSSADHTRISNEIGYFSEVSIVGLSGFNTAPLPEALWTLTKVKVLQLQYTPTHPGPRLLSMPKEIGNFIHLQFFQIRDAALTELPEEFYTLPCIEGMDLRHCSNFSKLSSQMENFRKLAFLSIVGTKITELPNLTLQILGLDSTQTTTLKIAEFITARPTLHVGLLNPLDAYGTLTFKPEGAAAWNAFVATLPENG